MMESKLSRNFPIAIEVASLGLLILICNLIGGLLAIGLESQTGFDLSSSAEGYLKDNRGALRTLLFFSNAFMFLLPALLFSIILYQKDWLKSVKADIFPSSRSIVVAIAAIFFSMGLIAYSFYLNQLIPLPEILTSHEEKSEGLIAAALHMESFGELLVNLFIVALIPAIGEEWIFRGILQGRFLKWIKNDHVVVWLVAIIFSAVHFQFQGFIPRMILGALLGYMFLWSKSLWLPIIVHFFNNGSQIVYYYFASTMSDGQELDISQVPDVAWWQGLLSAIAVIGLMIVLRFVCNKSTVQT